MTLGKNATLKSYKRKAAFIEVTCDQCAANCCTNLNCSLGLGFGDVFGLWLSSGRLLLSGDGLELGFRLWFWSANTKSHASGKSKNPYLRILRKGFQFKRFLFLVNFQLPKICDVELSPFASWCMHPLKCYTCFMFLDFFNSF